MATTTTTAAAAAADDERPYATRRAVRVAKLRASAAGASLGALPADVLELVGERLAALMFTGEDKLNCLPTWARDVANIALSCKALYSLVRGGRLWAKLGELHPASATGPLLWHVRFCAVEPAYTYEQRHLFRHTFRLYNLKRAWAFDLKWPPPGVPRHMFEEVCRLKSRGVAAKVAKEVFLLSDGDIAQLQSEERSRGATLKPAQLYPLSDLIAAARAKHGTEAGLEAAKHAREAAADERRRQAKAEAVSARRKTLREELAALGVELKIGDVLV